MGTDWANEYEAIVTRKVDRGRREQLAWLAARYTAVESEGLIYRAALEEILQTAWGAKVKTLARTALQAGRDSRQAKA